MNLTLQRTFKSSVYTIGKLFIDGSYFCDTLEDPERKIKIPYETCIPEGIYEVILNYSKRFQRFMPLLLKVPHFEGIRIHAGNTAKDTSGCILVGYNTVVGRLTESQDTFVELYDRLSNAKDKIAIEIL